MTKWTSMQDLALTSSGNLLISASAGSGKTSVMVQKVIDYLFSYEGADISKLVVITFTKASAEEMRQKLTDKLYEMLRKSDDHETRERIRKQINGIPLSNISTIDSFCADIFKRYFEVIDKDPLMSVMEQSEADHLFAMSREEVIESYLSASDPDFAELVEKFTAKRDIDMLRKAIDDIHKFLAVQTDGQGFIIHALARIEEPVETSQTALYVLSHYRKTAARLMGVCEKYLALLHNHLGNAPIIGRFFDSLCKLRDALSDISSAADLRNFYFIADIKKVSPPRLTKKPLSETEILMLTEVKRVFSAADEFMGEVANNFGGGFEEALAADAEAKRGVAKLFELALAVEAKYRLAKDKERRADYADIEHYALEILRSDAVADEIRASVDNIFIDEYQDTNYLQESIIARISENNVFMVGDVKQSIYKFRFAEPRIFLDKRKNFETGKEGVNISFNENFRSTEGVLDFINLVFDEIMTYDFGGIDYRKDARLKYGPSEKIKKENSFPDAEIALFCREKSEAPVYPEIYSVKDAPRLSAKTSQEALHIADRITAMVGKALIYDARAGKHRPCRYGDIAVLFRSKKGGDIITELKRRRIPFTAEGFRDNGDTSSTDILISFAEVLDNPRQDMPLAAAMLSYFGKFDDKELLEIRARTPKGYFWEAVYAYSGDISIESKVTAFLSFVEKYRRLAAFVDMRELFDRLIAETGYDGYLMSQGANRIRKLNAFVFSLTASERGASLKKFLDYCASAKDDESLAPAEDCVTLSSIHAAKGLEYPVVFIARTELMTRDHAGGEVLSDGGSRKRVYADMIYLDTRLGIALKHVGEDSKKSETISTIALAIKHENDKKEELVRLLYVAMTRARQHLFISGKECKSDFLFPDEPSSFAEWLTFAGSRSSALEKYYSYPISEDATVEDEKARYLPSPAEPCKLQRAYAYPLALGLSCKYSVSSLNKRPSEEDAPPAAALDFDGNLQSGNIDLGIAYHTVLQHADFYRNTPEEVDAQIQSLLDRRNIEELPAGFDRSALYKAFANPYFRELANGKCYREQPFMLYLPAKEIGNSQSEDKILVQGIIDLLSTGAENVIVDYKYTGSPAETLRERYRKQLEIYTLAAEKALGIKIHKQAIYLIGRDEFIEL